jgi:transposase InsO family protein
MQARLEKQSRGQPRYRGLRGQRGWREQERAVRRSALVFLRWLQRRRSGPTSAAQELGIALRTLRDWSNQWGENQMKLKARGRPAEHADRELRRQVLALFGLMGPHVGLPTLQAIFPNVARGELVELQKRYRRAFRRGQTLLQHVLRWTREGSVWAMDFAQPPQPIDGFYPKQALVRDLASHNQLAALPVPDETGPMARMLLDSLGRWMGYPLVLKVDNGSAFISEDVRAWARKHEVLLLYSPPGTPEYNGSIERRLDPDPGLPRSSTPRSTDPVDVRRCRGRTTPGQRDRPSLGYTGPDTAPSLAPASGDHTRRTRRLPRAVRPACRRRTRRPRLATRNRLATPRAIRY